jgi:hypothetical protein
VLLGRDLRGHLAVKAPTWKSVALALGGRMSNHAFCDAHARSEADDDCPFCRDRAVYDAFVACCRANGVRVVDPFKGIPSVELSELRRTP